MAPNAKFAKAVVKAAKADSKTKAKADKAAAKKAAADKAAAKKAADDKAKAAKKAAAKDSIVNAAMNKIINDTVNEMENINSCGLKTASNIEPNASLC